MGEENRKNKFEIHIVGHDDVIEITGFGGKNAVIKALVAAIQEVIQKGEIKYDA